MSDRPPKNVIPQSIEPRRFAQKAVNLNGEVPAEKLQRLSEAVHTINSVQADLNFLVDQEGKKRVEGSIKAYLQRECQRCLELMDQTVDSGVNLAIVWDDEQARHLGETTDPWIVAEDAADLYAIIEEEILLNMPYMAYHEFQCVEGDRMHSGPEVPEPEAQANNPFAEALKGLKK